MRLGELAARLAQSQRETGKGRLAQLVDLVRLRCGAARLGADEYFLYRLYDDASMDYAAKSAFLGWRRADALDRQLNDNASRRYANDKLAFATAMAAAGLATPPLLACWGADAAALPQLQTLATRAALEQFLADPDHLPLFAKPVHGTYGRGGFSLQGRQADGSFIAGDGTRRSIDDIEASLRQAWARGYLFQGLLRPHPQMAALVGDRLSSLRMVVVNHGGECFLHRAVWKFPVGSNMSDNFMHGELGNLIAAVDVTSGRATLPLGRGKNGFERVAVHPDTGASLANLSVPRWQELVEFALQAAGQFPGLGLQHWDIAPCPQGPVALEVNVEGSMDLHQLAGHRGVFDERLAAVASRATQSG